MKRSSANPVKSLGGIDSYTTSQDQFAAECYIRYNSDTVAPHSAITGIADVALRYHHIFQTRPSHKFIKPAEKHLLKFKGR
jgi:hypothetical protein